MVNATENKEKKSEVSALELLRPKLLRCKCQRSIASIAGTLLYSAPHSTSMSQQLLRFLFPDQIHS